MADPYLDDHGIEVIRKSGLIDEDGNHRIRTNTEGEFSPSGLKTAGQVTSIPLNTSTWVALERSATTTPAGLGPLPDRNAISIQNNTDDDILLNYVDSGLIGVVLAAGNERYTDITDSITIYAKAVTGTPSVILEEQS